MLISHRAGEHTRDAQSCRARPAEDAMTLFRYAKMEESEDQRARGASERADDAAPSQGGRSVPAVVAQVDHRVGERLEGVMHVTDAFEAQQPMANLSSQAKSRSTVRKRSSKIAGSKRCLRPRFGVLRPRGFSGIFGVMPRLKIALRLARAVIDGIPTDDRAFQVLADDALNR